ncbi:bla regulator protein blaR1 [Clostridium cavendishii DSM 21758]|uniref:Bla regulator protein blaR1 n=1 Tax=Clostridium cavendishii DSM 21758 TaxID=1121302 RepID=A0A1M6IC30_9CLOT|nr:M56 family metallopeptidase [Clostridium cavendishii]SHJ32042.1 bla regulator protein blaR1 [Clostridium cavendishii DSM 21758]
MLQVLFNIILNISITASIVALIIILLKLLFKDRLPPSWHYYIWLLLIIRLLIPTSFSSSFSIFNLNIPSYNYIYSNLNQNEKKFILPETNLTANDKTSNSDKITEDNPIPQITEKSILINFFKETNFITITWFVIALILLTYFIFSYFTFINKINNYSKNQNIKVLNISCKIKKTLKIKRNIPVYFTKLIKTPCIVSLLKPRILIPKCYLNIISSKELDYILIHELTHYKKKDLFLNWIFTLLLIIYWFNPIIWFCFFLMKKDCELCCDFNVMKKLNGNERIEYGETLIKIAELSANNKNEMLIPGMASIINKKTLKRRIQMIPKFKNLKILTICLAIFVTVFTSLILLTDKKVISSNQSIEKTSTSNELSSNTNEPSKENPSSEESNSKKETANKNNDSNNKKDFASNTTSKNNTDTQSPKDKNVVSKSTSNKEIFFGNWIITKHLASGPVTALSDNDINNVIGKKLSFSEEKSSCFGEDISSLNNIINNPVYKKSIISKDNFAAGYRQRLTFEKLGISSDSITDVTVTDQNENSCYFFIKDNNTLILSSGGVYFQLNRI